MDNIIIRGARGVGKSTLIDKLARESGCRIFGFRTKLTEDLDGIRRVHIHPADEPQSKWKCSDANMVACSTDAGEGTAADFTVNVLSGTSDASGGDGKRSFTMFPAVFDTLGTELVKRATASMDEKVTGSVVCRAEGSILVLDELGFLEEEAHSFQQAVLDALEGEIPVIAAVKNRPIEFLEKVCVHPRSRVFDITPVNRDVLADEIRALGLIPKAH